MALRLDTRVGSMTQTVDIPPGRICCTSYGQIQVETAESLLQMARHAEQIGLTAITWSFISGTLVDRARNDAAIQFMQTANPREDWLWFIDGDMLFDKTLIEKMLKTAFVDLPQADILGGYCNLKGAPYLPTIDRGSGTWEAHDANIGPVEVIRTGAACLLIKRHVFDKIKYPWFGVFPASEPLEMLAEVDGFARRHYDGRNPLAGAEWDKLTEIASGDSKKTKWVSPDGGRSFMAGPQHKRFSTVGEDSGFCDRARAAGLNIFVNTDAVVHHIDRKVIGPADHQKGLNEAREAQRELIGVMS